MMLRATSTAVVTLILVGFTALSSAKPASFADYLASKSSSSVQPAYAEGGYEPTEVHEACLKDIGVRNCRDIAGGFYFE